MCCNVELMMLSLIVAMWFSIRPHVSLLDLRLLRPCPLLVHEHLSLSASMSLRPLALTWRWNECSEGHLKVPCRTCANSSMAERWVGFLVSWLSPRAVHACVFSHVCFSRTLFDLKTPRKSPFVLSRYRQLVCICFAHSNARHPTVETANSCNPNGCRDD